MGWSVPFSLGAYKPGKTWVFLQDELLNYLKSTKAACPSTVAPILRIGGPDSNSTAARSASRLAREIAANLKAAARFAVLTGLRMRAMLSLTWQQVDLVKKRA